MSSTAVVKAKTPVERVKALLYALIGPSDASLFPFIPRPIKLLILLVFFLNRRSWPGVWHWRVWKPVFAIRWDSFRNARTLPAKRAWLGNKSLVGKSPFEIVEVHKCFAGLDDCDYNAHLSNSCYAKNLDAARMKCAVNVFPAIFGDGVWMALGGAHYQFVREIPYNTEFEVRTVIGSWEEKWMFLVHYFVSFPKKKGKSSSKPNANDGVPVQSVENGLPSLTTPSSPSLLPQVSVEDKRFFTIPKLDNKSVVPENAVLHCVAISTYCFKIGRITVPPNVAFVGSGFGSRDRRRWFRIQNLRFSSQGASKSNKDAVKNRMSDMFRGEWKTDNEVPGFWELDEYEEERKLRMEKIFGGIHEGFKALKA
ncbi:hypothetical protein FRC03_006229 [Tulasnella sp. 419]|nr:hypothetical protein FRC03_006229 [Tulasnella sp. 419]